ncbi:MAG TPA: RNA polymerase sigma factor [Gemmatimonadaceae bacterium]|nr:RNA polymerase sigma factor [Gemmatimonadaceae bacterium]
MTGETLHPELSRTGSLVAQTKAGDLRAFEHLVAECKGSVFRWALAFAADADEADDIVQEVFVIVLRHIRQYRGDGSFDVWLYRITRRAASRLRKTRMRRSSLSRSTRASPERVVYETDPGGRVDRERAGAILRELWMELPEQQRCVLDLVDLQGNTPQEAAEMLELNPSTLRANLFKARKSMRDKIVARHPDIARAYMRDG